MWPEPQFTSNEISKLSLLLCIFFIIKEILRGRCHADAAFTRLIPQILAH